MSGITIDVRPATVHDGAGITELGIEIFRASFAHSLPAADLQEYLDECYTLDAIREDITNPLKTFIVATTADQRIVGFAILTQGTFEPCVESFQSTVELQRLYVDLHTHGMGVGKALSLHLEDIARQKGYKHIWLGVWEENFKAQKVYEKMGYKKIGDHPFKMGNVTQTDYIMIKEL